MELTINDKNYELKFGLSFINTLDNIYTQTAEGMTFGIGIEMLQAYLSMGRPTALANAIKAATSHLNSKPSNNDLEAYLETLAEKDEKEFDKLFDEIEESMQTAPFLKRALQNQKQAQ